jgi:hypothetical protein
MTLPNVWSVEVPGGYQHTQNFQLTNPDGSPYPVDGATWEYVVRFSPADTSGTPLIRVTTTASSQGVLAVTTSPNTVIGVTLNPTATAPLPAGIYSHALVMNPGTASAMPWIVGSFVVDAVTQT